LADFVELTIEQGATFSTEVTVNDANGFAKDLQDYTVRSQIRKSYYSTTAIDFEVSIDSPTDGLVTMELSAETTSNIAPGRYVYDVQIEEDSTGIVTRIFEGIATVLPGVTR
jgi:hypothetical protein